MSPLISNLTVYLICVTSHNHGHKLYGRARAIMTHAIPKELLVSHNVPPFTFSVPDYRAKQRQPPPANVSPVSSRTPIYTRRNLDTVLLYSVAWPIVLCSASEPAVVSFGGFWLTVTPAAHPIFPRGTIPIKYLDPRTPWTFCAKLYSIDLQNRILWKIW